MILRLSWNATDKRALLGQVAELVDGYLQDAQARTIPVSEPSGPAALEERFAEFGGLGLEPPAGLCPSTVPDLLREIIAASVHTSHPKFFNQNFAGPDIIALAGDWLGASLNTTAATYEMSPVFTLMERALLGRMAKIAGIGEAAHDSAEAPSPPAGLLLPGGSYSNLLAMQLARHRAAPDINRRGDHGHRWAVFTSAAAHYSIRKSARLMGLGDEAVYEVDCDPQDRMLPDALDASIREATAAGLTPLFVNATSGTTVLGAFDPLREIAAHCKRHKLWLHVDGCFGAACLLSERHRDLMDGVALADSLAWNLHKVMGVTQQCAALLLRDPARLRECFATEATYLFQDDKPYAAYDTGDLGFQCARRVDALKAWLAWKLLGDDGMSERVVHATASARAASAEIERRGAARGWQLMAAPPFVSVCARWIPGPLRHVEMRRWTPADRAWVHRLQSTMRNELARRGVGMLAAQPLSDGINCLRFIVMSPAVQASDIIQILDDLEAIGEAQASIDVP